MCVDGLCEAYQLGLALSVREGGSGGAGCVEPAAFSWNDMASTASTSIVSCCFDKGRQGGVLQELGRTFWKRIRGEATVGVAAG